MRAALVMCSGVDAALKQAIRERRRIGETSPDGVGEGGDPMSPVRKGDMQAFTHGQRIGDLSALRLQLCTRLRSAGPELQSRSVPNTLLPNG